MSAIGGPVLSPTLGISDGQIPENIGNVLTGVPVDNLGCGRATLTTAVPVTTSDVTFASEVFFTPHLGNRVVLYDGTRAIPVTFTEQSIKITDAQSGTTTNGNKIISGLTDTSKLFAGMKITGTNVGAASVIATIDSATQVTGTVNSTGSATNTMTFKMPASSALDVFGVYSAGAMVLRPGTLWTNLTTRADTVALVNGRYMNTSAVRATQSNTIAANTGLSLFSIRTTGTDGQTEDSNTKRYVWNNYNRVQRKLLKVDTTINWPYSASTYQQANANAANQVEVMLGQSIEPVEISVFSLCLTNSGVATVSTGVGVDSTSVNSAQTYGAQAFTTIFFPTLAFYTGFPGIGYHYLAWLEAGNGANTQTWAGQQDATRIQAGMRGFVWA